MSTEKPLPPNPLSTPGSAAVTVHDTAHVADKASLTAGAAPAHSISVGQQCVLHPHAKIDAGAGPVALGDACVVWEKAVVGVGDDGPAPGGMTSLGRGVVVGPHAVVCAGAVLGDRVNVGVMARVGAGAVVGADVTIVSAGSVAAGAHVPDGAVVGAQGRILRRRYGDYPSAGVLDDLAKAKDLKDTGDARHRALMRKLVKGQAGGSGRS